MKLYAKLDKLRFEIEEDLPEIGFYIFVYDEQNNCISDYLQDTQNTAKEFALEEYGVPFDSWETKRSYQ